MTTCQAWVCPSCAPTNVRQQAMATAIRVMAVRDTLIIQHGQGRGLKVRRAVLSPPPERSRMAMDYDNGVRAVAGVHYRKEPPRRRVPGLRHQAMELAKEKGFIGGVLVFHPWRDRQTWEFKYPGPHFHIIGMAHWLEEGDDDGWLFKASNARLRLGGVYDRMVYDLTHVGVAPSRPVVTYWGRRVKLALAVVDRIEALETGHRHVCPECSGINTRSITPTMGELERWGLMRPLERHRRELAQHRFKCDDCGHVDGTEPVPRKLGPEAEAVNPWHYEDPDRGAPVKGDHWNDGDI